MNDKIVIYAPKSIIQDANMFCINPEFGAYDTFQATIRRSFSCSYRSVYISIRILCTLHITWNSNRCLLCLNCMTKQVTDGTACNNKQEGK
jgi:hypothetical protein